MKCGEEVIKADAYVMAFGSYSTAMLKGILDIPVYPLKGYSLTIPVKEESGAPVSTILDETYKIAITRFDNRIRVGGMAEIVGFNTELLKPRRETLRWWWGPLPARWLCRAGDLLDRPASDDAGRHADCGAHAVQKPVDQYRTRYAWLDDGLRLRAAAERPDFRTHAGHSV